MCTTYIHTPELHRKWNKIDDDDDDDGDDNRLERNDTYLETVFFLFFFIIFSCGRAVAAPTFHLFNLTSWELIVE